MLGVELLMHGQNSLKLFWEFHNVPKGEDHSSGAFVFREKVCEAPCGEASVLFLYNRKQSCFGKLEYIL